MDNIGKNKKRFKISIYSLFFVWIYKIISHIKKILRSKMGSSSRSIVLFFKKHSDKVLVNFYKTNYKYNVLISYIKYPFITGVDYRHTNSNEVLAMASVFKELGFNIDVVNYHYEGKINYNKYDIIIGFGEPIENSFQSRIKKQITIYYGTGMHVNYQNYSSLQRVKDVFQKTNVRMINGARIVEKAWSIQTSLVDAMICLGNTQVANTYKKYYQGPIYELPVTAYNILNYEDVQNQKSFDSKQHFLRFGSTGLIHKGLDLLLDIFGTRSDLHLHICGPIDSDPVFKEYYYKQLYETPNIHCYGFVDLKSIQFKEIISKCAFVILPSCSEAESTAVVNCMALGLIPIITKETGIDTNLGITIQELTEQAILISINESQSFSAHQIKEKSQLCYEKTKKRNNIENYKALLHQYISSIMINNK